MSDSPGLPLLGLKGRCSGKFPPEDRGLAPFWPCLDLSWARSLCPLVAMTGVAASPVGKRPTSFPGPGKQGDSPRPPPLPGGTHTSGTQAKGCLRGA